jgi:hypothetical protein
VLYDRYRHGMEAGGYPDFIESDGGVFITETNKKVSRIHAVDAALVAGLFGQRNASRPLAAAPGDLVYRAPAGGAAAAATRPMPRLPSFYAVEGARQGASRPGCLGACERLGVLRSKSSFVCAFVWARRQGA